MRQEFPREVIGMWHLVNITSQRLGNLLDFPTRRKTIAALAHGNTDTDMQKLNAAISQPLLAYFYVIRENLKAEINAKSTRRRRYKRAGNDVV